MLGRIVRRCAAPRRTLTYTFTRAIRQKERDGSRSDRDDGGADKNKAGAASLGLAAPTHGNGHCPHPSNRLGIWIHRMPEVGSNINLSAPGINT